MRCSLCKSEKQKTEFYPNKSCKSNRSTWCKSCTAEYHKLPKTVESKRRWRQRIKQEAVKAYGSKCACCGETELAFLTLDHINGSGTKHRKELKMNGGTSTYSWLKRNKYPKGFQVLCFNCNCGRNVNRGICPHKEKK